MGLQQACLLALMVHPGLEHNAADGIGSLEKEIFIMLTRTYNHFYARKFHPERITP
jgi:hypothetical protein